MNKVLMNQKICLLLASFMLLMALPANGAVGDKFDYSYKGVNYSFVVLDETAKTCSTDPGYFNGPNDVSGGLLIYSAEVAELPASPRKSDGTVYKLVALGDFSFPWSSIKEVIIPEGVKTIGQGAFYSCSNLETVTLPSTVTSIGWDSWEGNGNSVPNAYGAFEGCKKLSTINTPTSLKHIGYRAFVDCSALTGFDFTNITNLGESSFQRSGLTSVTLENTSSVGGFSFAQCPNLANVDINCRLTTVGDAIFYECKALRTASMVKSNTTISDYMFRDCSALTSIPVPGNVSYIGKQAFAGCRSLKDLTMVQYHYIRVIKEGAFRDCTGVKYISLPDNLETIEEYAFYNCASLPNIKLSNKIRTIGDYSFAKCSSLTSLDLPGTLSSLGIGVFSECSNLSQVNLQNGLTEIPENTFLGDTKLKSIELPSTLTVIGPSAFRCSGLTNITIPPSVTTIGTRAFGMLTQALEYVMYQTKESIPQIDINTFCINSGVTPLYVADGKKSQFTSAAGWSKFDVQEIGISFARASVIDEANSEYGSSGPRVPYDLAIVSAPAGRDGVEYTSSNPSVAYKGVGTAPSFNPEEMSMEFVEKEGIILTGEPGTAVITATLTHYGLSATFTVTVLPSEFVVGDFKYSPKFSPFEEPPTPMNPVTSKVIYIKGFSGESTEILNIPQTVTYEGLTLPVNGVGDQAFRGDSKIKAINIPANIVEIGYEAFTNLPELEALYVEPRTGTWGYEMTQTSYPICQTDAFKNCPKLKTILWAAEYATVQTTFSGDNALENLYVAEIANNKTQDIYNSGYNFDQDMIKVIPATSKISDDLVFSNDGKITTVIPTINGLVSVPDMVPGTTSQVVAVDAGAFKNNNFITGVTLPASITSIGASAFEGCANLESLDLPSAVTSIGNYAFRNSGITSLNLSDNVTT